MEHLKRSFDFTVTHLGPHKLPLIGRADWMRLQIQHGHRLRGAAAPGWENDLYQL